jgi:glucokinase
MSKEKVILGMDIGGTGMRAALVNAKGEIRGRFVDENRKKETLEHIGQVIEILRGEGNDLELETVGIGIGLAGLVDPETELLVSSPTMVSMEGMNFRKEIEAISKLPVVINNDANSAGYAEWKLGAGTQTNSAVALFVGTGVGGAIILDGDLYVGKDGVAGEVGHLVVSTDGPDCPCGGKGCLEQLGSGTAVHRFIEKSLQQGRQSVHH